MNNLISHIQYKIIAVQKPITESKLFKMLEKPFETSLTEIGEKSTLIELKKSGFSNEIKEALVIKYIDLEKLHDGITPVLQSAFNSCVLKDGFQKAVTNLCKGELPKDTKNKLILNYLKTNSVTLADLMNVSRYFDTSLVGSL